MLREENCPLLDDRKRDFMIQLITEIRSQLKLPSLETEEQARKTQLWMEHRKREDTRRLHLTATHRTIEDYLKHDRAFNTTGVTDRTVRELTVFLEEKYGINKLEDLRHGTKEMLDVFNQYQSKGLSSKQLSHHQYNTMVLLFEFWHRADDAAPYYWHDHSSSGGSGAAGGTSTVVEHSLSSANPYFV